MKLSGEGENGAHYSIFRGMENACIDSVVLRKNMYTTGTCGGI